MREKVDQNYKELLERIEKIEISAEEDGKKTWKNTCDIQRLDDNKAHQCPPLSGSHRGAGGGRRQDTGEGVCVRAKGVCVVKKSVCVKKGVCACERCVCEERCVCVCV